MENEASKPVYAVTCSNNTRFVGYSESGPVGSLIILERPLQYTEIMQKSRKDPSKGELGFALNHFWRALTIERLTVRWETVAGPEDMSEADQQQLNDLIETTHRRMAMARSGLVDPHESPPADILAKMQERVRG